MLLNGDNQSHNEVVIEMIHSLHVANDAPAKVAREGDSITLHGPAQGAESGTQA